MIQGGWGCEQTNQKEIQEKSVGKVIKDISLGENWRGASSLTILFEDGTGLVFLDDGQSCCENRYMSVDGDDLSEFVGAKYVEAFVRDAPDIEDECGVHEVQFLEIRTSKGSITVSNHNEHNGYYGGFDIVVKSIEKE